MQVAVPAWVLLLGGIGIVVGLATYGYRVMNTIGQDITEITPSRAVAANVAAAATVLLCTRLKLPVSTSHTLVGALLVGLADTLGRAFLPAIFKLFVEASLADAVGASLSSIAIYLLMATVLALRPRGLFPSHG